MYGAGAYNQYQSPAYQPSQQQQPDQGFEVYRKIKLLGEGAFGKAFLVECQSDKSFAVIKQVDIGRMSEQEKQDTLKEAKILEVLNHPNIIRFREVYKTKKGKLCIVMDFADGGDLQQMIKNQRGRYFTESQILDWFTQICLGLKHVHDRKILHRDIKCQNVFLTKQNIIKMGDFGIARVLKHTVEVAKSMVGTPYYLSPEIIENRPYSFKSDIWSLGVMLYELCALRPPFEGSSLHFLALKIIRGEFTPLPSHFSRELKDLVSKMLTIDVHRRPNINQILKTPIISRRIKSFLNEEKFKDEFSHTILHKQHVNLLEQPKPLVVQPPVPKPPVQQPQIQRQPSAPQLPSRAVPQQKPTGQNIAGAQQPVNLPNLPGNVPYAGKASPIRGTPYTPAAGAGTPQNAAAQNNVFNKNNLFQKQVEVKPVPSSNIIAPKAVDKYEKERIERQEKYEKEKREKEELHKAMLDDIKKKKEEFKQLKNNALAPPTKDNSPVIFTPYNKQPQKDADVKDIVNGVRNRINELYQRQYSAGPTNDISPRRGNDDNTTPRNVFEEVQPPKINELPHYQRQQSEPVLKQKQQMQQKGYFEEQYNKYVQDLDQFLDKNQDEDGSSHSSDENEELAEPVAPQIDREDDDSDEESKETNKDNEIFGSYMRECVQEKEEPLNLADLRISMVHMPDDLKESLLFFEQLMKENYGEMKIKRALKVIEDFKGDIYKNEQKIIKLIQGELMSDESEAYQILSECSSYLILKQSQGGGIYKNCNMMAVM